MNYQEKGDAFLRRHGMHPYDIGITSYVKAFRAAMERGLVSNDSPFDMLPAYLSADGKLPEKEPVIVLDAGGTNLRIALLRFENGQAVVEEQVKYPMPGSRGAITKEEYLRTMAEYLAPFAGRADRMGYCFSYPAEILPDHDGRLFYFNKEVTVTGSEGMIVGREMLAAMKKAGLPAPRHFVLLNDTVAALLGGLSQYGSEENEGGIGFILGTGTNTCYIEKASRIRRYPVPDKKGGMIINMEAGAYDGFPAGDFDRILDAGSAVPGRHPYEKMISGVYQGDILSLILHAAADEGLFSAAMKARLKPGESFGMADFDAFMRDNKQAGRLSELTLSARDTALLRFFIDRMSERAARLVYINFAAVLEQTDAGRDENRPALIVAEGSGVWSSSLFYPKLRKYLVDELSKKEGRFVRIVRAENANLIGSAAAALLND